MTAKTPWPDYAAENRACCPTNLREAHLSDCRRQPGRCRNKVGYTSRRAALFAWGITGSDDTFMAYRCYSCDLWHIGRPSDKERT